MSARWNDCASCWLRNRGSVIFADGAPRSQVANKTFALAPGAVDDRAMDPINTERHPVEELAEEFLERYRRGEGPSVADYAARFPALAERIRTLFPTLLVMEQVRPGPPEGFAPPEQARPGPPLERLGDYRILR